MAIMIVAASVNDSVLEYGGSDEIVFVVCREPAIEINWLIDLKFIAN